jgi:hypothetical protein
MRTWSKIMVAGFPDPGPEPARQDGEPAEQRRAALQAHAWRRMAYRAVHGADPAAREQMLEATAALIATGGDMPQPAREWLLFVLGSLSKTDTVPALYRGRPSNQLDDLHRVSLAAQRYLELAGANPRERVVDRLATLADEFAMSESKMTKLYKSRRFKELLTLYAEGR